jgi:hypothetical protein
MGMMGGAMKTRETSSILTEAAERFKVASEAEEKQRERERADLEFQVPELQWDEKSKQLRQGDGQTSGRPMLSISKLSQPRRLILNQMRSADLGINIHPISEKAESETAEILQAKYREIERKSRAELARAWAFDRAVQAGRGAYRVLTEYDDESEVPSDQRIVIKRIYHQDGVYFDPSASEPDYSDGRYAFVVSWMSASEFKRQFPKAKPAPANKLEWEGMRAEAPEWVRDEDVLVAEYWHKEFEAEEFEVEGEKRTREKVKVRVDKMCGWDVLESMDWPGKWIPIIPTIGRELQPFDEERRCVGIVFDARDGQKLYNFAASTLVERMAMEPRAPFVAAAEVLEGYEHLWQTANIKNHAVLPFNAVVKDGAMLPPPQRAQIDASGMSIALMALQEADGFIQATTAVFDPSLGKMPQKERSGRAIMALQQQADAGTSDFLQNLADISLTYEARVVLDLIPKIYDRPGRITRIVRGDDKKTEAVMLGQPYIMDPKTKQPRAAQPGEQNAKTVDLARGIYDVSVNVGKGFQTRLQEGSERIGEMLANKPELFMMMGDLFLRYQDWPGSKEMADRMAKVREKQFPGLGEGEDGQIPPEQQQAMLQGMKQQLQAQGQQMQAMQMALETDRAKQEAAMAKAQLDAQTKQMDIEAKLRMNAADNQTKLTVAGMEGKIETLLTLLELESEARQVRQAQAHDAAMMERSGARETSALVSQQQHEVVMGELGRPEPEEPVEPQEGE